MTYWLDRAACRDEHPELFFPVGSTGPALVQTEQARAVCHRCPVIDECLTWALSTGQDAGVWGGLTPEERRALRNGPAGRCTPTAPGNDPAPNNPQMTEKRDR